MVSKPENTPTTPHRGAFLARWGAVGAIFTFIVKIKIFKKVPPPSKNFQTEGIAAPVQCPKLVPLAIALHLDMIGFVSAGYRLTLGGEGIIRAQ